MAARFILLMGMQGAGKGTQAEAITHALGIPHVTSGGMFREIMKQDSPLATEIRSYYDAGKLVPDDLTIQMIRGRLSQPDAVRGVILDGFPRTVAQAQALDSLLASMGTRLGLVANLDISEAEALVRVGGRRVCTLDDNHVYHIRYNPPHADGICDIDGALLKIRSDDQPDEIRKRIDIFKRDTRPVLEYYAGRDPALVRTLDAEQPIEAVTADLMAAVEAL